MGILKSNEDSDLKGDKSQQFPKVSFLMLTYNQAAFVEEALRGALSQTYKNMEIIVSDDASTDGTFEICCRVIESEKRGDIVALRNERNLGLCAHINSLLSRCTGEIILLAAGDDISLPERAFRTVEVFAREPGVSLVAFTDITINEDGEVVRNRRAKLSERIVDIHMYLRKDSIGISGASRGFRRSVYDVFGDLSKECPTEDTPYLLRSLMLGNAVILGEPGIKYRKHSQNLSGLASLTRMSVSKITDQYSHDVNVAREKGIISDFEFSKITAWIRNQLEVRTSINAAFRDGMPGWNVLIKLLLDSKLSWKNKKSISRKFVIYKLKSRR